MCLLVTLSPAYDKQCEKAVHESDVIRLECSTEQRRTLLPRTDFETRNAPDARLLRNSSQRLPRDFALSPTLRAYASLMNGTFAPEFNKAHPGTPETAQAKCILKFCLSNAM